MKKKAGDISVGDYIELDVGIYGPHDEFCKVLDLHLYRDLFNKHNCISFLVGCDSESFWTAGFLLDKELNCR